MARVSVVVPVYNVEKYLRQCLDSVINQDYKDIEIIIVDDESTDNSGIICDEYAEKYSFIEVVHKKNGGLGFARNTGIEKARGEYIIFVDSDDTVGKMMITNLLSEIDKNNADTVVGGFRRIDIENRILSEEKYKLEEYIGTDVYHKLFPKLLGSSPKGRDNIKMSVWNVMFSMKIIKENKLRFVSERELISEDIVWNIEYFKYSKKVRVIPSTEYNYRVTPGSLTQKYRPEILQSFTKLYNYLENKIKSEFLGEEALQRLQRQFFVNIRYSIANEKKVGKKNIVSRINKIVRDETVQRAVFEYPINEIGFKQRIFLYMLKNKWTLLLAMIV